MGVAHRVQGGQQDAKKDGGQRLGAFRGRTFRRCSSLGTTTGACGPDVQAGMSGRLNLTKVQLPNPSPFC